MGMEAKQPGGDPNRFDWFDALDEFNQRSDARPQVKRAFERIWRWAEGRENYVYGFTVKNLSTWLKCDDRTGREVFEELLQRYERKGIEHEGLWLVEIITNQAGVMKLYVYDPRTELRQIKPEPDDRQQYLFDAEPETPSGIFAQESPTPAGAPALRVVSSRDDAHRHADPSGICAQESPTPSDHEPGGSPHVDRPNDIGCAVAEGHPLPALMAAIRAKLGADRSETWLGRNHFSLQGDTLICACPTVLAAKSAFSRRNEILEAIQAIAPEVGFRTIVKPEVCTASQGSGISAQESPSAQEACSSPLEPLQGSKGEERKKDLRGKPPERLLRETALGRRAAEIHALIDDETCWRWCCILAAYAEQQGWLTPHRTNALAAEPYFCKSLKKALAAQNRYLPMYPLKMALRRLGIKWQRDWDTGHTNFWAKHGERSNLKPR